MLGINKLIVLITLTLVLTSCHIDEAMHLPNQDYLHTSLTENIYTVEEDDVNNVSVSKNNFSEGNFNSTPDELKNKLKEEQGLTIDESGGNEKSEDGNNKSDDKKKKDYSPKDAITGFLYFPLKESKYVKTEKSTDGLQLSTWAYNRDVSSVADGIVYSIGYQEENEHGIALGNYIWIEHIFKDSQGDEYKYYSIYGRLKEKPNFEKGDKVIKGQVIGKTGLTGEKFDTDTVRLHFQIMKGALPVEPKDYFKETQGDINYGDRLKRLE